MIILTPSDSSHGEEGSDSGEGFHAERQPKLSVHNSKLFPLSNLVAWGELGAKHQKRWIRN